jgi:hypothetical protein
MYYLSNLLSQGEILVSDNGVVCKFLSVSQAR